jgi:hypothetical protein
VRFTPGTVELRELWHHFDVPVSVTDAGGLKETVKHNTGIVSNPIQTC